tara:strand:+ start:320 stop:715 length:396 start_codon:yes stop_codon:yes gene_type:complete
MTEETHIEPTTFEVAVYASVWKSDLELYLAGIRDNLSDHHVDLHIGTVPTEYSQFNAYMPVGKVTVKIPTKVERIQCELLAIDAAIEDEKERSMQRLEDMAERKKELLALEYLPEASAAERALQDALHEDT